MEEKIENPYVGLPEEKRWEIYKRREPSLNDIGFFLLKDFSLPNSRRVLLVGSSRLSMQLFRKTIMVLWGESTKVDTASHEREVLQKLKENDKYDLIICPARIVAGSLDSLLEKVRAMNYQGVFLLHTRLAGQKALSFVKERELEGFILKPHGLFNFAKAMQNVSTS